MNARQLTAGKIIFSQGWVLSLVVQHRVISLEAKYTQQAMSPVGSIYIFLCLHMHMYLDTYVTNIKRLSTRHEGFVG